MSITFTDDRSRIFFEGEPIAACPSWLSGRITDASLTYVEDTAYYYLFITWGDEGVDSHMRVGRSRCVKGPYLDPQGRSLIDWDDAEHPTGFLFLSSFSFDDEDGIRGPFGGHLEGKIPSPATTDTEKTGTASDKTAKVKPAVASDETTVEETEAVSNGTSEKKPETSSDEASAEITEAMSDETPEKKPEVSSDEASAEKTEAVSDETLTKTADETSNPGLFTVPAGSDCFFLFHKSGNVDVTFPVLFSDDGWPLICPGEAPEDERVVRAAYTLKELQGFYECVTFVPAVPQVPYSSNFAALLPNNVKGIMSMQSEEWACPISEDADGRVELGGSIRGSYRLDGQTLHLAFAHDRVSLCMCTATDASNGFPTIFLTGKSDSGIAYMLKKITLPQPNHYNRK